MLDLLALQKELLLRHIRPGGTCADLTMGNGHDTLFLSRAVGEGGRVYAFDVQPAALESTAALLKREGAPENVRLICDSHHRAAEYIREPLCVGMFNLGWLPGSDRTVTTRRETTLPALQTAIGLLAPDGAVLMAVYPGHEEGRLEGEAVCDFLATLDRRQFCCSKLQLVNSPTSPYFFLVEKAKEGFSGI